VEVFLDDLPEVGIIFDSDVSQPLISRKNPFTMSVRARGQLLDLWRAAEEELAEERNRANSAQNDALYQRTRADTLARQIEMASESRWLRLGRRFGLGPRFTQIT
jgi:muconolactone delta-isomerase